MPGSPRLSPDALDDLARLLSRSLDMAQLKRFVFLATGEDMHVAYIADQGPLFQQIFELLRVLERDPITDRFLRVVYREKPFQFELRALIAMHYPSIPAAEAFRPVAFDVTVKTGPIREEKEELTSIGLPLETILRKQIKSVDIRQWLDRIETLERQVCRIEADQQALGTGFLVGPRSVLTNWHVVQKARDNGIEARLACRFDFRRLSNGSKDPGVTIDVASVIDESPCSAAELTVQPAAPPPTSDELDYALLELADDAGGRGHVRLAPEPPVEKNQPLIIVQHPNGEPMRFAIDTDSVIGYEAGRLRLRYRTNTEPGSSGSPCFSMDFDLLALHHLGERGSVASGYNQGIPIGLIDARIRRNGHDAHLGG